LIWNAYFDFHQLDHKEKSKYTFLIIHLGRINEKEYATRLIRAARALNWKGYEASLKPCNWAKKISMNPFAEIIKNVKPDFVISMTKNLPDYDISSNYLLLSHRDFDIIQENPSVFDPRQWKGILTIPHIINKIENLYPQNPPRCLPWYPSSIRTEYYRPNPKRLFQATQNWPLGRYSASFNKLRSLLNRSGYLDTYNPPQQWTGFRQSPLKDNTNEIEAIHQSGIALVLHSDYELGNELPSLHFFDALAASSVIITDRHPFIEKEFQDSVLYIDRNPSGEEMFQKVDAVVDWIWDHQEESIALAEKAHSIFYSKFAIEKILIDLEKFHLKI
jgi:hypothetical protein